MEKQTFGNHPELRSKTLQKPRTHRKNKELYERETEAEVLAMNDW
jgi:hypothetical protein